MAPNDINFRLFVVFAFSSTTDRPVEIIAGGSLSQLAALDIALDATLALRPDQIVCHAIAAPGTGNHEFAKAYDAAVPPTWNVINDQVSEAVGSVLYETLCSVLPLIVLLRPVTSKSVY